MKNYPSLELPHIWAHQQAPSGSSASAMSFAGKNFFSYGVEIARIVNRAGKVAVVVNGNQYSDTTSRHQNLVRKAIPHDRLIIEIGSLRGAMLRVSGKVAVEYAIKKAAEFQAKAKTARVHADQYRIDSASWLHKAQDAATFFGMGCVIDDTSIVKWERAVERAAKRQAKKDLLAQEAMERKNAKIIKSWVRGMTGSIPSGIAKVYLRRERDELVTSKGARVPIAEAQRCFRFIIARKSKGWHRNGETFLIGKYPLDAVNKDGIVAGCHRIGWEEIERFAKAENWK